MNTVTTEKDPKSSVDGAPTLQASQVQTTMKLYERIQGYIFRLMATDSVPRVSQTQLPWTSRILISLVLQNRKSELDALPSTVLQANLPVLIGHANIVQPPGRRCRGHQPKGSELVDGRLRGRSQ